MNMIYNETASIGDRDRNAATFLVVELLGRAESSTSKHYFRQAIVKSSSCQWCDGSYLERAWYPVFETSARQLLLILTVESFTILRRIAPTCKERERKQLS